MARAPAVREMLDRASKIPRAVHVDHEHAAAAYIKRIPGVDARAVISAYTDLSVWNNFDPGTLTLCGKDQGFSEPFLARAIKRS